MLRLEGARHDSGKPEGGYEDAPTGALGADAMPDIENLPFDPRPGTTRSLPLHPPHIGRRGIEAGGAGRDWR